MRHITLIFLLLCSFAAQAQSCPLTPALIANECLTLQLKDAEAKMAEDLNQLLLATPINEPNQMKKAEELLLSAQDQWRIYSRTHCEYEGFIKGGVGSYKGVYKSLCLVQKTNARSAELKTMLEHYE